MLISPFSPRVIGYSVSVARMPIGLYGIFKKSFLSEETAYGSCASLMLVGADVAGTTLYMSMLGVVDLTEWGIEQNALISFVALAYIAAYIPWIIDSLLILTDDESNKIIKRQAILNLSNAITQIFVASLVLVGYSPMGLIVPFYALAATFGITSFAHKALVVR